MSKRGAHAERSHSFELRGGPPHLQRLRLHRGLTESDGNRTAAPTGRATSHRIAESYVRRSFGNSRASTDATREFAQNLRELRMFFADLRRADFLPGLQRGCELSNSRAALRDERAVSIFNPPPCELRKLWKNRCKSGHSMVREYLKKAVARGLLSRCDRDGTAARCSPR